MPGTPTGTPALSIARKTSLPTPRKTRPKPKSKSKKQRQEVQAEKLYAVRGIIEEELRGEKLFYKIDWANDSETGESYPPSWEPAEHATAAAVAEWEDRRNEGTASPYSSPPQPICSDSEERSNPLNPNGKRPLASASFGVGDHSPNKRKREKHQGGQIFSGIRDSRSPGPSSRPKNKLVVGIVPRSDLNKSEYLAIGPLSSPSQSQSQSRSQSQSQSQSQSHSQSLAQGPSLTSQHSVREPQYPRKTFGSQSTIPDSQEISQSLPSQPFSFDRSDSQEKAICTENKSGSHVNGGSVASLIIPDSDNTEQPSLQDIPSRQPDSRRELTQTLCGSLEEHNTTSGESASLGQALIAQRAVSSSAPSPYLTQLPFDYPHLTSSVSRVAESSQLQRTSHGNSPPELFQLSTAGISVAPGSSRHGVSPLNSATPAPSAQLVLPPNSNQGDIRTQSNDSTSVCQIEIETDHQLGGSFTQTLQQEFNSQVDSQGSNLSQPLSESDGNKRHPVSTTKSVAKAPPNQLSGRHKRDSPARAAASGSIVGSTALSQGRDKDAEHGPSNRDNDPARSLSGSGLLERLQETAGSVPASTSNNMATSPAQEPTLPSEPYPETPLIQADFNLALESSHLQQPSPDQAVISPSSVLPGGDNEPLASIEDSAEHPQAADFLMGATLDFETRLSSDAIAQLSAVEQLKRALSLEPIVAPALDMDEGNATVAPADLSTGFGINLPPTDINLSSSTVPIVDLVSNVLPGIESYSPSFAEAGHGHSQSSPSAYMRPQSLENEFIVTLPMANNTRYFYLEAILQHRETMTTFGEAFQGDTVKVPDDDLVGKLDRVFEELYDLCDLPAYADSLPNMTPEEMKKHATGTNSKFSFIFEFLDQIRGTPSRVVIVSQPGRVFQYIDALLSSSGFNYSHLGSGDDAPNSQADGVFVTLASSDQIIPEIPDVDIFINFDHTARDIKIENAVCVLFLVVACTIEHIDLKLASDMVPMERRNAMNYATVVARKLVDDTERDMPQPHEVAQLFADFINNPSNGIDWDPQELPDIVFDYWLGSQPSTGMSQQPLFSDLDNQVRLNGRKRQLDDDAEDITTKRVKRSQDPSLVAPPQLSDLLKSTLQSLAAPPKDSIQKIEVGVLQLESMAAKMFHLEEELRLKSNLHGTLEGLCKNQEILVKSHERTAQKIAAKYYEALSDRGVFEKQCDKAVRQTEAAEKRAEESKVQVTALKEEKTALESKLANANAMLASSAVPEVARFGEMAKELEEARAKMQSLEKKIAIAQNETDYSRQAYQDASNRHGELSTENTRLIKHVADLKTRANDNIVQIHKIQAENEKREDHRVIAELRAITADRERELERVREELRILRNGRRETRQASVPRSPRMGVLSPRNGRGGGGGGGGGGSRGNSPALESSGAAAAGMSFLSPGQSNGRWDHLHNY